MTTSRISEEPPLATSAIGIFVAQSSATKLTYLDSKSRSQSSLLRGENGLAALTFCEVRLLTSKPTR